MTAPAARNRWRSRNVSDRARRVRADLEKVGLVSPDTPFNQGLREGLREGYEDGWRDGYNAGLAAAKR